MDEDDSLSLSDKLWTKLLGDRHCATYNGAIDLDVLTVAELVGAAEFHFNTDICLKTGLEPNYVELIQYLLCGADLAEYGTSPRGCWLTDEGKAWLAEMKPWHDELLR